MKSNRHYVFKNTQVFVNVKLFNTISKTEDANKLHCFNISINLYNNIFWR